MGRRSSPNTQLEMSVSRLSESFGLDRATITKRLNEAKVDHKPGPRGAKLYKVSDAIRACLVDFLGADQPGTYDEARTRDMKARAQLTELELAVRRNELLPANEVERAWSGYIGRANTILGGLSTSLAPLLVPMTDEAEIKALIDGAVDEARSELSRDVEADTGDAGEGDEELDADSAPDDQ